MRSFLLASIAALTIPACTQDITGVGGPGDDQQGAVCGNGTVETGEACDDGNTTAGDGCSATCTTETSATPRIAGSVNPVTVELYNPLSTNLSLTSEGGFAGTVTLAAQLVDGAGAAITGATVTIASTVDLTDGQTQSVPVTIMVPTEATGTEITGMLKIDATTATTDPVNLAVAADIKPFLTIEYTAGTGATAANHTDHGMNFTVLRGATIKIKNSDTMAHRTHAAGANFVHEPGLGPVGGTYELPVLQATAPGSVGTIGCHDHSTVNTGTDEYMNITVM